MSDNTKIFIILKTLQTIGEQFSAFTVSEVSQEQLVKIQNLLDLEENIFLPNREANEIQEIPTDDIDLQVVEDPFEMGALDRIFGSTYHTGINLLEFLLSDAEYFELSHKLTDCEINAEYDPFLTNTVFKISGYLWEQLELIRESICNRIDSEPAISYNTLVDDIELLMGNVGAYYLVELLADNELFELGVVNNVIRRYLTPFIPAN